MPLGVDKLIFGEQTVTVTGNTLYVNGNHANLSTSGVAPSTSLLAIPISINTYGGLTKLAGDPNGWLLVNFSGQSVKIPYYI